MVSGAGAGPVVIGPDTPGAKRIGNRIEITVAKPPWEIPDSLLRTPGSRVVYPIHRRDADTGAWTGVSHH